MTESVRVEGAPELQATLLRASAAMANLSAPNGVAGRAVVNRARGAAPRLTGRLAASLEVANAPGGVNIGSPLVYAPVIHWGWPAHGIEPNPFLAESLDASQTEIVAVYARFIDNTLGRVKGA